MTEVFTQIDQITPEWLSACLHTCGVLPQGHVVALSGQAEHTLVSVISHIIVQYSPDAPSSAPTNLFLKMGSADTVQQDGWQAEVRFYQQLAATLLPITVPCYHAAYTEQPARFHLLLADLCQTHHVLVWPLPATLPQLGQAVDCLAQLHAVWWNHPQFGQDVLPRFTPPSLPAWLALWEQRLRQYLDVLGERLSSRRRRLYEWILPRFLPLLYQRRQEQHHWTLVHQDAHAYNFLFPHHSGSEGARLIDWSSWDIGLGARDLAYLVALHFFPEQRAEMEYSLLQRYHNVLVRHGIHSYTWEQLWYDYRLFVIRNLLVPIEQFIAGVPASVWWWHIERSWLTFDDLACAELLS